MDPLFKNISEASRNLSAASDLLTKQITEFEASLGRLRLGVSAWVTLKVEEYDPGNGGPVEYQEAIGYGKHKGKWGLLYARGLLDLDENVQISFLSDASRDLKLKAVAKMPNLMRELDKQARELERKVTATAETLHALSEKINR